MAYLETSEIHRHLESQFKILGVNAQDLLLILILASIMNLIFGQTSLNIMMVFIVPGLLALGLIVGKRNKPNDYLIHLARFQKQAGFYSAALTSKNIERNYYVIKR